MRPLLIVTYHYVRQLEGSAYPSIKGLTLEQFRAQLDYLCARFDPVSVPEVVHSLRTGDKLPDEAVLLTFDDGYVDHFRYVFPLLVDYGIRGAFFPPVEPVKNGKLLDVNRVHFILAACRDRIAIADSIDAEVRSESRTFDLKDPAEFRQQWAKANRFDDALTIYIKRMLQVALPQPLRERIAARLFREHVTADEESFARELYMDEKQLSAMQRGGMYIGSHGRAHVWLDSLTGNEQADEIDSSLSFLRQIGSPVDDYWVMSYPYGGWNENLLGVLRSKRCTFGVTTECRVAQLDRDDPLLLPRLDTNDVASLAQRSVPGTAGAKV
jgi:Predicted xylanase/chitin deacetylase